MVSSNAEREETFTLLLGHTPIMYLMITKYLCVGRKNLLLKVSKTGHCVICFKHILIYNSSNDFIYMQFVWL